LQRHHRSTVVTTVDTVLPSRPQRKRFSITSGLFASCVLTLLLVACSVNNSGPPSATANLVISAPQSSMLVGDSGQLAAHLTSSDGGSRDVTDQVTWSSSTAGVVKFGPLGSFTAQEVGSTAISANYGGLTATTALSVTDHFTVIAIPDTQRMIAGEDGGSLQMLKSEFNWIKDHRVAENIQMVAGEGDIVDSGNVMQQWSDADSIYQILDDAAIPYAPAIGNHDYDIGGGLVGADRSSQNYNHYFGPQRFAKRPWYGTSNFPPGQGDNFYVTFDAGIRHYMVLELEFLPRPEAIPWAQSILDSHPGYQVILLTHGYLNDDGALVSESDYSGTGFSYWGLSQATASDANQLWNELIRKNPSIIAVLCGHTWPNQVWRADKNDSGALVPQFKADFEADGRGGSGMLRIMKFYPAQDQIDVSSYSPYFDQWLTDSTNQFTAFYGVLANSSQAHAPR
jgi:hypothetical protein